MKSNESLVHAVERADRIDRINAGNNQVEEPTKDTDMIDAGTKQVE